MNTNNVYVDESASISDARETYRNQLQTLYNHVIKYMCQEHIQSTSHINTILEVSRIIRTSILKLSKKKQSQLLDEMTSELDHKILAKAIIQTVDEGIKGFTKKIDRSEILKEFPIKFIMDEKLILKFLKDHAVNYETCKRFDLPEPKKIPKATISAKNARILS